MGIRESRIKEFILPKRVVKAEVAIRKSGCVPGLASAEVRIVRPSGD
jgi:hypothetical protein